MKVRPPGWSETTLGEVAQVIRNGLFKTRPSDQPPGLPILRISAVRPSGLDLAARKYVQDVSDDELEKFSVRPGDLLLTRYNGSRHLVGMAALVPSHAEKLIYPDKLIRVALDADRADARFINYQLASTRVRAFIEPRIRTTAGQSGISGVDVKTIPLVLPSLTEQRRIVDLLEDYLSRLDAGRQLVVAAERRLATFTREYVQQVVRADSQDEVALGELIERVEAGRSFGGSAAPASGDDWGVIKVSAMTWGEFRPQENKAVPADLANPDYEIKPGDILVSRANTTAYVGAPVLVRTTPQRRLLSDKSLRLVPRPGVDREWLVAVLSAPSTRQQVSVLATGTSDSMRNISQRNLLAVQVPWVDGSQQAVVVSRLADARGAVDRLSLELEAVRKRSHALRRALLQAAFSGRLRGRGEGSDVLGELVGATT